MRVSVGLSFEGDFDTKRGRVSSSSSVLLQCPTTPSDTRELHMTEHAKYLALNCELHSCSLGGDLLHLAIIVQASPARELLHLSGSVDDGVRNRKSPS